MVRVEFTGERLQPGDPLFAVDLARHEAAYAFALDRADDGSLLDLGSGSGYGTQMLASNQHLVVGLDRVAPVTSPPHTNANFVRGNVLGSPFASACFSRIVSFQVIEHFEDPAQYVTSISSLLAPHGEALISTPNRLTSDGVNPYHLREYSADELRDALGAGFESVEMLGVSAGPSVQEYFEARQRRIARIMRLDFLRLREVLPDALIQRSFALLATWIRRLARSGNELPRASWKDFPIGPCEPKCLDLLAICRHPRKRP